MKNLFRLYALALTAAMFSPAAHAQDSGTGFDTFITAPAPVADDKPALSTPETIAMTFYKLAGKAPDFDAWAQQSAAYKTASELERPAILERETQNLKESFKLLTLHDPLIIETQVQISNYNETNHGFFIESFKRSTFFPASYNGQSFALVPQDVVDKQWIQMNEPAAAQTLEKAAEAANRVLKLIVFLNPKYVDSSGATQIGGESYWPIVADIKKMMLFSQDDKILWQSNVESIDTKRQSILNLYK